MKKLFHYSLIVLVAAFLCFVTSCQKQPVEKTEEVMSDEELKSWSEELLSIWNEGNLELIEKYYSPDVVIKTSSMPQPYEGYEGVRAWVNHTLTAYPDFHMTFDETYMDGNVIFVKWTATGTNTGPISMPSGEIPATGKSVKFMGVALDYLENGLITEEIVVMNMMEMLTQLGFKVMPPSQE